MALALGETKRGANSGKPGDAKLWVFTHAFQAMGKTARLPALDAVTSTHALHGSLL